ncbi:hypothetical protein SBV1_2200023 [Verrucomicrobia bacterium]|nr:hypothetical protein SBV1_2200023 [Verrucomicrobiota bacterium]
MNAFVDFNKRGMQLPAGCKDLIDVLRGPVKPAPRDRVFLYRKSERLVGTVAEVGRYVQKLLDSESSSLGIVLPEREVGFSLQKLGNSVPLIFQSMDQDPLRRAELSAFLNDWGIKRAQNLPLSPAPRPNTWSVPQNFAVVCELISKLLRTLYGLPPEAKLEFFYHWYDKTS